MQRERLDGGDPAPSGRGETDINIKLKPLQKAASSPSSEDSSSLAKPKSAFPDAGTRDTPLTPFEAPLFGGVIQKRKSDPIKDSSGSVASKRDPGEAVNESPSASSKQADVHAESALPPGHSLLAEYFEGGKATKGGKSIISFPFKLHELLRQAEAEGHDDVVSFFPHGKAFAIFKPNEFVRDLMPRFFSTQRLSSFHRQLNLYGFKRVLEGENQTAFYHEYFIKGQPELASKIKRRRQPTPKGSLDSTEQWNSPSIPEEKGLSFADTSAEHHAWRQSNAANQQLQSMNQQLAALQSGAPDALTMPRQNESLLRGMIGGDEQSNQLLALQSQINANNMRANLLRETQLRREMDMMRGGFSQGVSPLGVAQSLYDQVAPNLNPAGAMRMHLGENFFDQNQQSFSAPGGAASINPMMESVTSSSVAGIPGQFLIPQQEHQSQQSAMLANLLRGQQQDASSATGIPPQLDLQAPDQQLSGYSADLAELVAILQRQQQQQGRDGSAGNG